jgi:hypothetical protein
MTRDDYQEPTEPTVEELELEYLRQERSRLSAERDSLRAALVEAQEIGARKDEALNDCIDEICNLRNARTTHWAEADLQQIKRARAALALTQTPNLYRELQAEIEGLNKEVLELEAERDFKQDLLDKSEDENDALKTHLRRFTHLSSGYDFDECKRIIEEAAKQATEALSAIGRKGGE